MNGSNGRSPRLCARSWIRSHSTNAWRDSSGRGEQRGGVRREVERQHVGGVRGDGAQAGGLAVAEDRAEVVRGLVRAHRDGLREQHRGVGLVAGRPVHERDRHELRVLEARALELREPLGPRHADDQRLEDLLGRPVLLVHREHDEVLDAVLAVLVGAELLEREREVRRGEAVDRPGAEVALERRQVRVLVREVRAQRLDRVQDRVDLRRVRARPGRSSRRRSGARAAPRSRP